MTCLRHILITSIVLTVQGCGSASLFIENDLPESQAVRDAPYPRLVDVPESPDPGSYNDDVPDPAIGIATVVELKAAARETEAKRQRLDGPVIDEATKRRLLRSRK